MTNDSAAKWSFQILQLIASGLPEDEKEKEIKRIREAMQQESKGEE